MAPAAGDRAAKIEKARELRAKGLLYREIAEELGVSVSTAYEWITGRISAWRRAHPELVRAQNLARNDAKREWEDSQRADCPQCGQPMGLGSAMASRHREKCATCRLDDARARTVRFIQARREGLNNREIARREGCSQATVANALSRAKQRFGLEVPSSPYWSRAREQVAA